MFKNKFKKLIELEGGRVSDFEIISDKMASTLSGGCRILANCGTFHGTCPNLDQCGTYTKPIGNT